MIAEYKTKGNWFGLSGVALAAVALYLMPLNANPAKEPDAALALITLACRVLAYVLWITGCIYYARAKGYSPLVGLVGMLSILGLIILAALPDKQRDA